jgi:hypothetical protein
VNDLDKQCSSRSRRVHYIDDDDDDDIIEQSDSTQTNKRDSFGTSSLLSNTKDRHLLMNSTLSALKSNRKSKLNRRQRTIDVLQSIGNSCETHPGNTSDTEIDYRCLEGTERVRTPNEYANRNGTINFGVILAGLHSVICKEDHWKICELTMNIVDVLFGLAVISSIDDDRDKKRCLDVDKDMLPMTNDDYYRQIDGKDNEKYHLAMDIILRYEHDQRHLSDVLFSSIRTRILKRLGCSTCQAHTRTFILDQLRGKVRLSLNRLHQLNPNRFERYDQSNMYETVRFDRALH